MSALDYPTGETYWEADGIPVLHAVVSLPKLQGSTSADRRMLRYYRMQYRAFLTHCQQQLLPMAAAGCRAALAASRPPPLREAELSFRTTCQTDQLWSLYTQLREPLASGGEFIRRWGDTWDLRSGLPLSLSDLITPGTPWKRLLLQEIQSQLQQTPSACADLRKAVRRKFSSRSFYIEHDHLVIFYPMLALRGVAGIPAFSIPREVLPLRLDR